jgi:hypothetical protein
MRAPARPNWVAWLVWLIPGAAVAVAAALASSCTSSNCLMACTSSWHVDFDAPIGQPGKYEFQAGPHTCAIELPAASSIGCALVRDFSVVGLGGDWYERSTRELHVTATRDGVPVLAGDAALVSFQDHSVCGQTCSSATFSMHAPAELAPSPRPPCDVARLTGTYAVSESSHVGSCGSVFSGPTLTLANGVLVPSDPACQGQLTGWAADACRAESTTTCTGTSLAVTWTLSLTDLLTDGSKLVGTGQVSMSSPVVCEGAAGLQLVRQ